MISTISARLGFGETHLAKFVPSSNRDEGRRIYRALEEHRVPSDSDSMYVSPDDPPTANAKGQGNPRAGIYYHTIE